MPSRISAVVHDGLGVCVCVRLCFKKLCQCNGAGVIGMRQDFSLFYSSDLVLIG